MPCTPREPQSLEQLVQEIRRIRVQRFFSLSDSEIDKLASQHESVLPFLYEIYYRYGESMDDRMKSTVAICMLSKDAEFEQVYRSLNWDASNRQEVLERLSGLGKQKSTKYN